VHEGAFFHGDGFDRVPQIHVYRTLRNLRASNLRRNVGYLTTIPLLALLLAKVAPPLFGASLAR
jgi:hypothetical protein